MMGSATHVTGFQATLAHERIEVEDTAAACVRFACGALGVIQATTSVHPGLPKTIAIHGDRGTAVIEQEDILRWEFTPETPAPLLPTAPMVPAACVPWSLSSIGLQLRVNVL